MNNCKKYLNKKICIRCKEARFAIENPWDDENRGWDLEDTDQWNNYDTVFCFQEGWKKDSNGVQIPTYKTADTRSGPPEWCPYAVEQVMINQE